MNDAYSVILLGLLIANKHIFFRFVLNQNEFFQIEASNVKKNMLETSEKRMNWESGERKKG